GIIDRIESQTLESSIQRAIAENRPKVVFNCEKLKYIDSRGIGILLAYLPKARARGGDLRFSHMGDIARTWISMFGLQNMVAVYATEAEAVASYRGAA
ncbi:MAG TPA: STAS domain-containing protein, partial [Planctomycetota bacterium]|nr:STAS domain-containing protein [Planctomycetota bacterium]